MSKALKLGVLGSTLAHSKSPEIQTAGLKLLDVEGSYEKYEIDEEAFNHEVPSLLRSLNGINITIPYKETILKYLNKSDPLVERIGATNTLVINERGIEGFNTDHYGFMESLKEHDFKGKSVSLIGAGGAAKAIIIALEDMGVNDINVYARNPSKAEEKLPRVKKAELNLKLYTAEEDLRHSNLIINTTPVGQGRLASSMPLTVPQLELLKPDTIIYDLIYGETQLIKEAKAIGLETHDGAEMLILQGAKSLSLWTGKKITDKLVKAMTDAFYAKH